MVSHMIEEIIALNEPGKIIEMTIQEAEQLGAIADEALSEEDALESVIYEKERSL